LSPDLATVLREETPSAPPELRERVAFIAATAPPRRRSFSLRRFVVYAAPTAAAASLLVAVAVGLSSAIDSPSRPNSDAGTAVAPPERQGFQGGQELHSTPTDSVQRDAMQSAGKALAPPAAPAPSATRAQDVQADLRILVDDTDDLSTATQRALRTTRRLGGYLVTVDYGTPEPTEGSATIRVRIPRSRVQAAIVQFSGLGTILGQQTRITDLQERLDDLTRQLRRAKGDKVRTTALRRQRAAIERRAAFATVDLALTTREPEREPVAPSRFDRAVDNATGVLTTELAIAAYLLIVAAPFLLLLGAGWAGARAYRRYADQRLLERA
jgi:Domain of unknown function (DUF4349)